MTAPPVPARTGCWLLDPGHPDAADHIRNMYAPVVKHYDADGIQFDRVRYTDQNGAITVARYTVSASNPDAANPTRTVLLSIPHPGASNHNGGQLAFGTDGMLYIGTGDGGGSN
ncbi:family 10 glycosylhydrolase, partial [Cupriavidus pampae]|uniref:family 10 glycosylhydrolase n=1 Tax=Cupriavidus pampae TaxID=659251 RepID=UPI00361E7321